MLSFRCMKLLVGLCRVIGDGLPGNSFKYCDHVSIKVPPIANFTGWWIAWLTSPNDGIDDYRNQGSSKSIFSIFAHKKSATIPYLVPPIYRYGASTPQSTAKCHSLLMCFRAPNATILLVNIGIEIEMNSTEKILYEQISSCVSRGPSILSKLDLIRN